MVKSTFMLIAVTATLTSIAVPPLTRLDNVTRSTLCRHDLDADLRPPHSADAAGSDVTSAVSDVTVDATKTVNVTRRRVVVWTYYPFPYDPWLGWYIAAIISGLIVTLVFCEVMDRAKHAVIDYLDARLSH